MCVKGKTKPATREITGFAGWIGRTEEKGNSRRFLSPEIQGQRLSLPLNWPRKVSDI